MSSSGGNDRDDACWRRLRHAWNRYPIHRFAYDLADGHWEQIDSLSYKPLEKRRDLGALQKRLLLERSRPNGEPGVHMHPSGCPIRYPDRWPIDDWVRPFIKVGKRKEHPRPFFYNPKRKSGDDTPEQRYADRDTSERIAAIEEIFAGAEAAGWKFGRRFPSRVCHADAACWTIADGQRSQLEVAFRVQLGPRVLWQFVEAADTAKEKEANLIWLMAQRDDKDVATLPDRILEVPIVRMEALLNKRLSTGEADGEGRNQEQEGGPLEEADSELFRVAVGGPGTDKRLSLARYAERLLRAVFFRRDPVERLFFAPLGWISCPKCRTFCLSFGDFKPNTKDVSWEGAEFAEGSLPLTDIVDRPALQNFPGTRGAARGEE